MCRFIHLISLFRVLGKPTSVTAKDFSSNANKYVKHKSYPKSKWYWLNEVHNNTQKRTQRRTEVCFLLRSTTITVFVLSTLMGTPEGTCHHVLLGVLHLELSRDLQEVMYSRLLLFEHCSLECRLNTSPECTHGVQQWFTCWSTSCDLSPLVLLFDFG